MKFTKVKISKILVLFIFSVLIGLFSQHINVIADETSTGNYSISQTTMRLEKGKKKKLKVFNLPKAKAKVKWSTSNKFAVKVSSTGMVTAKNYGVATIKATCKKKVVSCVVTVPDTSRSVVLSKNKKTIKEGETYQLEVASKKAVTYIVRNDAIAHVDENGLITGVNPGKTSIIAKSKTGYDVFVVTVVSTDEEIKKPGKIANKKYARIRRYTTKNNVVYDRIVWANNKDIRFKLDGVDENQIKKCIWKTADESMLSIPISTDSKIIASARTLNVTGRTKVIAEVRFRDNTVKTYSSYVYITAPNIETKDIAVLDAGAGENRQQYIAINGLGKYSNIKWSVSNQSNIQLKEYNSKLAVTGLNAGIGIIKATVDGKTFKINYKVYSVEKGYSAPIISVKKTTQIELKGIDGLIPKYLSRNSKVAAVTKTGQIKGKSAGVTYIDVKVANMIFIYRVEVAAKGMKKIINRGKYIVNNWTYSQSKRYQKGYYDCSALVWKSYKTYNDYHLKIGGEDYAYSAGDLFDFLESKGQIIYYGYLGVDDLKPGDLIFYGDYENAVRYSTPGRTLDIYHVSLYAGNGQVVEKDYTQIEGQSCKYIVGVGRAVK